jgi:hypothetical protein
MRKEAVDGGRAALTGRELSAAQQDSEPELLMLMRSAHLHIVKSVYWERIEQGIIPRKSVAAALLLKSVDVAMDKIDQARGMDDWSVVKRIMPHEHNWDAQLWAFIDRILPDSQVWDNEKHMQWLYNCMETQYYMCSAYIEAHEEAQEKVASYFGESDEVDTPEELAVIGESARGVASARLLMDQMDRKLVASIRAKTAATQVIGMQKNFLRKLAKQGICTERDLDHMLESIERDEQALKRDRKRLVKKRAHDRVLSMTRSRDPKASLVRCKRTTTAEPLTEEEKTALPQTSSISDEGRRRRTTRDAV